MPDPKQLPHLVRLVDDHSESVRQAVMQALLEFGTDLESELRQVDRGLTEDEIECVLSFVQTHEDHGASESSSSKSSKTIVREALFKPGQSVRHTRYGYRGVVVEYDNQCMADDQWYESNRTQPPKNQPWYHVLVDGSDQNTYAAQSSLMPDASGEPIQHPLVEYFFSDFRDGVYRRNDRPWPTA